MTSSFKCLTCSNEKLVWIWTNTYAHNFVPEMQGSAVEFCCLLFLLSHGFATKLPSGLFSCTRVQISAPAQQKKGCEQFVDKGRPVMTAKVAFIKFASAKESSLQREELRSGNWNHLSIFFYLWLSHTYKHTHNENMSYSIGKKTHLKKYLAIRQKLLSWKILRLIYQPSLYMHHMYSIKFVSASHSSLVQVVMQRQTCLQTFIYSQYHIKCLHMSYCFTM